MRYALVLALALLGACAPTPERLTPVQTEQAWELHQRQLATVQSWFLRGRLAIRADREGWNANLHWRQQPGEYVIRMLAPLGQGTVELRGNADRITLQTPDNELLSAPDPETLLLENLGWSVPVDGLFYWVRGLPQPGVAVDQIELNDAGRLTELSQAGWQVLIEEYMVVDGITLPRRLQLDSERFHLRLVVQDWDNLRD